MIFLVVSQECGILSNPSGGSVSIDKTTKGGVAAYSCNPGFEVTSGDTSRTCQADGDWSGDCSSVWSRYEFWHDVKLQLVLELLEHHFPSFYTPLFDLGSMMRV